MVEWGASFATLHFLAGPSVGESKAMTQDSLNSIVAMPSGIWERHAMAVEDVTRRLERITQALTQAAVPFALVGGQAVAMWVATKDPAAVRTTKDVDILIHRDNLSAAQKAARSVGMDYFEVIGVGMFLDRDDPNPRSAVHLVWSDEKVRPQHPLPSPSVDQHQLLAGQLPVISLEALVLMKLMANRDLDRVHLRDLIDVGLIDRNILGRLPDELAPRLDALLSEFGL